MPASYGLETCPAREAQNLLASGWETWLGPAESLFLAGLRLEKRRRDWLAGRVAAKRALRSQFEDPRQLEILNAETGTPYARAADGRPVPPLSLSHCDRGGACAVSSNGGPIGVDWETIRPRDPGVLALYRHPSEPLPDQPNASATALWALKEAVLKLLGAGLQCDPRQARFLEGPHGPVALFGQARALWRQIGAPRLSTTVQLDEGSALAVAWTEAAG